VPPLGGAIRSNHPFFLGVDDAVRHITDGVMCLRRLIDDRTSFIMVQLLRVKQVYRHVLSDAEIFSVTFVVFRLTKGMQLAEHAMNVVVAVMSDEVVCRPRLCGGDGGARGSTVRGNDRRIGTTSW
jgi:hypothetical protein